MTYLRLSIEPIPASSCLASLAKLLPRRQWNRIRRSVYRRARYRCRICGQRDRLHCHEVWQYNEKNDRQRLLGFQALCRDCHDIKHILFVHGSQQRARFLQHFMTVNRVTREQAEEYLSAAYRKQRMFNQKQWVISYGKHNWQVPSVATIEQRRSYARFNHPRRC